jgi:hypothetical protein
MSWIQTAIRLETIEARKLRARIRARFSASSAVPVIVQPGNTPPTMTGKPGGHFTKGGARVYHPGAYSRRGWSNLVYRCSSQVIHVGADWKE